MSPTANQHRDRTALAAWQGDRLRDLLAAVLPANRFYARKLADAGPSDNLAQLPFTTKDELTADQQSHPPYGTNLTYPLSAYSRMHQTSGTTTGRPMRWLDTPQSWEAMLDVWATIYERVGVRAGDRLFFAFSFGPFLGFWTAFDAASRLGYLCLSGGGMSTTARLRFLLDHAATVVLCTPTYALRLAEAARAEGIDLAASDVRALIVAGEPGGSIPGTRKRIEAAWGARVFDHHGMTEVGPVSVEPADAPGGLLVVGTHYIAEVIEPGGTDPVPAGRPGELVLTNLFRTGSPLIRYRTGDLVRLTPAGGEAFDRLDGGILGRTDDMIHLRGNNLYPSALESVIRRFPEVAEFRVEIDDRTSLTALRIEVEAVAPHDGPELAARLERVLRDELLFRAEVRPVPAGSLPRFEMKARRFVHHRGTESTEKTEESKTERSTT